MKKLTFLLILVVLLSSFVEKKDTYIWFPREIGVLKNCDQNNTTVEFTIKTDSRKKIEVHSFNFGDNDFVLTVNGKKLDATKPLYLNKRKPLQCKLTFKRNFDKNQSEFTFQTGHKEFLKNKIKINYGSYSITHEPIKEGREVIVNFSQSCNDSIRVYFPYGGTISTVTLEKDKDSISVSCPLKTISYGIKIPREDDENYFTFSKSDIGKYHGYFGSCHWGNSFQLTIK